jgi:hypothetical protein
MSAGNYPQIGTYDGQQSDTPLPTVAARAARQAIEAARPGTLTVAQALGRLALTGTIMAVLMAAFMAIVFPALQ